MKIIKALYILAYVATVSCQTNSYKTDDDNIVFKDKSGNIIKKADLNQIAGQINYEMMENITINPIANKLHQDATKLGQSGKLDEAIHKLQEAILVQPEWAYPTYDLAYTYLLKGDFDNALIFYNKTDELEPKGFFTAKTAIYALEGEKAGKFPKSTYLYYLQIEWTDDKEKKMEIAKMLLQKVPDFAPAWKALGILLDDKSEKLQAIEQGLSRNPDAETKGILLLNKAAILYAEGKVEDSKELLGNLIFSPDVTAANLVLAKYQLKLITQK